MYYWDPWEEQWKPFADQEEDYDFTLTAHLTTDEELQDMWERAGEGTQIGRQFYTYYDHLYVAVGAEKKEVKITDVQLTDYSFIEGTFYVEIFGENLTESSKVYVGGQEALYEGYDYDGDSTFITAALPPGEGTKQIYIVNEYGTSEGYPFTYPEDTRLSEEDVRLKLSFDPKEDIYEGTAVVGEEMHVLVELVNLQGERVRPDEVRDDFNRSIVITNLNHFDRYPANELMISCVEDAVDCEEQFDDFGNRLITGYLTDEGFFETTMKYYFEDEEDLEVPLEDGEFLDEAPVDLVVALPEEGIYDRIRFDTTPEEKYNYEPLQITSERELTAEIGEPFALNLQAEGGIEEDYTWTWGASSVIPPGLVLDQNSGVLRDWQAGDGEDLLQEKQPGTYQFELIVSDGVSMTSAIFTLTVTGTPERHIELDDLQVYGGEDRELIDLTFDPSQTSYQTEVSHHIDRLYLQPILGDYTVTKSVYSYGDYPETVTEAVYVLTDTSTVPANMDGEFELDLDVGWNQVTIIPILQDDGNLVMNSYTLQVNRYPSPELSRLVVQPEGGEAVTFDGSSTDLTMTVPSDTEILRIKAYPEDDEALLELNGEDVTPGISSIVEMEDDVSELWLSTKIIGDWSVGEIGQTYNLTIQKEPSDENRLNVLMFSPSVLEEPFDPDVSNYEAKVDEEVDSLNLYVSTAHEGAEMNVLVNGVAVNPSEETETWMDDELKKYEVVLPVGMNIVEVIVTAENGEQNTYTFEIERKQSSNAALSALEFEPIEFTEFDPQRLTYMLSLDEHEEEITMHLTPDDPNATYSVDWNNETVYSNSDSYTLPLEYGYNHASILVRAADGESTNTYTITIAQNLFPEAEEEDSEEESNDEENDDSNDTPEENEEDSGEESNDEENNDSSDRSSDSRDQDSLEENRYYIGPTGKTITFDGGEIIFPEGVVKTGFYLTIEEIDPSTVVNPSGDNQFGSKVWRLAQNIEEPLLENFQVNLHVADEISQYQSDMQFYLAQLNEETGEWLKLDENETKCLTDFICGTADQFGIIAVIASPSDQESYFTDIKGHWAEEKIVQLIQQGAISGYPDGTFKPNHEITRAEFVSIVVRAFELEAKASNANYEFDDTISHWARDVIKIASDHGLISGLSASTFAPDDPITREQMASILIRLLTKLEGEASSEVAGENHKFEDEQEISSWAKDAVYQLSALGLLSGYPDGTFRPKDPATRAEIAVLIMNLLEEMNQSH